MLNEKYIVKLAGIMEMEKMDAVYIAPSEELEFLMGFSPHMDERFQGLFVTKEKNLFYIVPKLNEEEIQDILKNHGKIYAWRDGEGFLRAVQKAFEDHDLIHKTIGVNGAARAISMLDIHERMSVIFKNGKGILEELRIIKTEEEGDRLREAAKLADKVFEELVHFIRPGMQEKDIKVRIEELFMKMGADGLSFEPIVASGPNSSKPHYNRDTRYIEEKDIIILDFGCKYRGFCSDLSRTVFIGGISEEEKKIYDIIYQSNEAGEKAAKRGVPAEKVDQAAREIIEKAGYGENFLNRLGHGIGYGVHEAPDIKEGNGRSLEKGMAFSIEPGIYLPGKFGIRIEDIVYMGENGAEVLNKASKEIIVIK
ncbi:Xaa-Pro aminopeptidase [Anaerosolibacter carboniphilus]|uniref:Xaa-Pro aminopeptidase n=1 Tax=Anaerosolibacter carboniphilus TaxID=1417629 RepID=A0A841L2S1_9FIRM|nr:aminopeptidase P family protein [Anaerosolibacter carboniphilus]MBB6217452.1 Xaa-Pro aminopeptidase [Anaerosolibacter carboniphilus]